MPTLHLLFDDREKTPLKFPETITVLRTPESPLPHLERTRLLIRAHQHRLEAADYVAAALCEDGEPTPAPFVVYTSADRPHSALIVERKASLAELAKNCLTRRGRDNFAHLLNRMTAWELPVLLIECPPSSMRLRAGNGGCVTSAAPGDCWEIDALLPMLLPRRISLQYFHASTPAQRAEVAVWVARMMYVANRLKG